MIEPGQIWRTSTGTRWRILEVRPGFVRVQSETGTASRAAFPSSWFVLEGPTAPKLDTDAPGLYIRDVAIQQRERG